MNLEEIAKKAYPYTILGTTAGLIWLANNPVESSYFYSSKSEEAFNFFVNCHKYYAPLEIATGFYLVSKIRDLKTTFFEPIIKNKYSFLTMQNVFGAACIGLIASQETFYKGFDNKCYFGAFINLLYSYLLNAGLSILEKTKHPHIRNSLKAVYYSLYALFCKKNNVKKLEKNFEKFSNIVSDDTNIRLYILSFVHSKEEERAVIEKSLSKLDLSKENYKKRNLITCLANFPLESSDFIMKHLFSTNDILRGSEFFQTLNLSEFMQCYEGEIEKTNSPEARLLYSLFLDKLAKDKDEVCDKISWSRRFKAMRRLKKEFGEGTLKELIEAKANKEWQKIVERIVTDERFETTRESVESKRVYRAGVYPILKTTILVKEDERSVLESELENLNYLREQVKNTDFEVANALRILDTNGKSLLVERYSSGRRLTEILEEKEDFEILSKIVQYLKLMHDKMPVPQQIVNPEEELFSILKKAQLDDKTKQIIYEGVKATLPNLSSQRVFDCDAHSDNWFVAGERIIAIDKPTRKAIPPEYDLNKLLNRGRKIKEKENLVRIYSSEDEFLFSFYNATSIKALSYFVFTQNSYKEKTEQGIQYLENAVKDLEVLKERFGGRFNRDGFERLDKLSKSFEEFTVIQSTIP